MPKEGKGQRNITKSFQIGKGITLIFTNQYVYERIKQNKGNWSFLGLLDKINVTFEKTLLAS